MRCDNGKGEYDNARVRKFAAEKGITLDFCPPYIHQLNGTAERLNRSIMDMGRCLLAEAKINKYFWPEIIMAAAYLKNKGLANTAELKTSFEIFFKKKPDLSNLHIYGSRARVHIPQQKFGSKWDQREIKGILIGYSNNGYRMLVNNKIIVTKDVEFIYEDRQ